MYHVDNAGSKTEAITKVRDQTREGQDQDVGTERQMLISLLGDQEIMNEYNSRDVFMTISTLLGDCWRLFGRRLGLYSSWLENIEQDCIKQEDRGFAALAHWSNRVKGTRSDLCEAIFSLPCKQRIIDGLQELSTKSMLQ
jgi:hypothetical protein